MNIPDEIFLHILSYARIPSMYRGLCHSIDYIIDRIEEDYLYEKFPSFMRNTISSMILMETLAMERRWDIIMTILRLKHCSSIVIHAMELACIHCHDGLLNIIARYGIPNTLSPVIAYYKWTRNHKDREPYLRKVAKKYIKGYVSVFDIYMTFHSFITRDMGKFIVRTLGLKHDMKTILTSKYILGTIEMDIYKDKHVYSDMTRAITLTGSYRNRPLIKSVMNNINIVVSGWTPQHTYDNIGSLGISILYHAKSIWMREFRVETLNVSKESIYVLSM